MAVLAHTSNELILDVFGTKKIIKNVEKYALNNNILVYNIQEKVYRLDLVKNITKKFDEVSTGLHEIKISENGTKFGIILKNSDLLVYSDTECILKVPGINTFEITDTILGYETDKDFLLTNLCTLGIFHRSVYNYQKYFLFKEFCILVTNKIRNKDLTNSDTEDEFKLIKVTQGTEKNIGSFKTLVDIKCKCSADGKYLLVNASTSYVKNSYFASTVLYLYDVDKNILERVGKLSNILDFVFLKKGFCVVYGNQPAYVTSYNYDLSIQDKYPKGVRNRVYINQNETYAVLAGFEQLAGTVESYNIKSKDKLCEVNELGASKVEWDTTGSYFYVSTLKYLKEDNRIAMYDYYGRKIKEEHFDCLSDSAVYGLEESFVVLDEPAEKFKEIEEEVYVPAILKNKTFQAKPKVIKPKVVKPAEDTEEELVNKIEKIGLLKKKMEMNEKLETDELNLILNENKIKKKLEMIKKGKK